MSKENALTKQKKSQEEGLAYAPTKKKIGFFSAMMVVVGATTAAGIFFKAGAVLNNSQGSIVFAMFCWIFTAFAVICMALALVEIASVRNDNLSIIGWCQTFNNRWVYQACKNFMCYLYLPLTYFFMPLYVIMSIQDGVQAVVGHSYDGFNTSDDWAIMMALTLGISVYFIVVCGISSRMGNIQNWIITSVKFLPLVFGAVFGFVVIGMNAGHVAGNYEAQFVPSDINIYGPNKEVTGINPVAAYTFANMTPGFGMFIAAGAIFFAYDGFYVAAGLQSEMKEPKKTPIAMLLGLIIVTIIYLIIAISMSLGSTNGNPYGFQEFMENHNITWLYATFQILIGVGVLGIVNGFALWSTRFIEDLVRDNELPFSVKMMKKMNPKYAKVGIIYNLAISVPVILVFCIIGGLGYINTAYPQYYGTRVPELYSFADLMATWSSVLAFLFLLCVICGAYKNRSTNKIKVQKTKYFKPMAIICIITMALPIFITFFAPIADMFFLFRIPEQAPDTWGYNAAGEWVNLGPVYHYRDVIVSRIMTVVVLLIFIALMVLPTVFENLMLKKKFGSLNTGFKQKVIDIAHAKNISVEQEILENLAAQKRTYLYEYEKELLHRDTLTPAELATIYCEEYLMDQNSPEVKFNSNNSVEVTAPIEVGSEQ